MKTTWKPTKNPKIKDGRLFDDYENDWDVVFSQWHFLEAIWNLSRGSRKNLIYNSLVFREVATGKWHEHWVLNFSRCRIKTLLDHYSRYNFDQYFCPNPFSQPRRKQEYALPTGVAWCDMDGSTPSTYDPSPSFVWKTSPDRYQGMWAWDKLHRPVDAEEFSRAFAYRHGGDHGGWSITKLLRLVGSINHKPEYNEPVVELVQCNWARVAARPSLLDSRSSTGSSSPPKIDVDPTSHDSSQVARRYRKKLHLKVRYLISNKKAYEPDRSACIFHIIAGLHEAGATLDEIASVIWKSPYFISKHGQNIKKLNEEIGRVISKLERQP